MYPTTVLVATIIADRQREAQAVRRARAATRIPSARLPRPLRACAAAIGWAVPAHAEAGAARSQDR